MNSAEYWRKRSEENAQLQFDKAEEYVEKLLKEYEKAMSSIKRDMEVFFQRYAEENSVSLAEARRILTSDELKEFKMTLEEFIEKAKNNADGRWTQQLNNVYYKTRVSRLEALLIQIRQEVEMLTGKMQESIKELLENVYTDTYYRTLYELQKRIGIGVDFARIDKQALEKVLKEPWSGKNYSQRIWDNRDKLVQELQTNLMQAFIRGDSIEQTTKILQERMKVSYSRAVRIVRTETSYIANQAAFDSYKASGIVKKYEYVATLDNRTSEICRSMDGKVFKLTEAMVGINFPPLHPHCRSTVVPYFDDEENVGERIARDNKGKTYYVPADMTYEEWYNKYVKPHTLPKTLALGNSYLPKALMVDKELDIWIPAGAVIEDVHVIAGKGVAKELKVAKALSEKYGGQPEEWQKAVGKVKSEKYEFDIHWYQIGDKAYDHKVKSYKERRKKNES